MNWARAFNRLENILDDLLDVFPEGDCDLSMYRVLDRDTDSAIYVQAQIAVVSYIVCCSNIIIIVVLYACA